VEAMAYLGGSRSAQMVGAGISEWCACVEGVVRVSMRGAAHDTMPFGGGQGSRRTRAGRSERKSCDKRESTERKAR
jgi:hypothetical protein